MGRLLGLWTRVSWLRNAIAGLGLGAVVGALIVALISGTETVVVRDVQEVDQVAVRGGWLDLRVTVIRNRQCPTQVHRWLWQPVVVDGAPLLKPDGKPIVRWVPLPPGSATSPPTEVGAENTYVLSLPLPGNIEAGDWYQWQRSYDYCSWQSALFGPSVREGRSVPFTIIEPPAGKIPTIVTEPGPVLLLPSGAKPSR